MRISSEKRKSDFRCLDTRTGCRMSIIVFLFFFFFGIHMQVMVLIKNHFVVIVKQRNRLLERLRSQLNFIIILANFNCIIF